MRIPLLLTALIPLGAGCSPSPSPPSPPLGRVALEYLSVDRADPFTPPVATEGFFLGFGQDVEISEKLEGTFRWGGKDYPVRLESPEVEKPVVRIEGVLPLPEEAYPSRKGGYLQGWFELQGAEGPAQRLRFIGVFAKGRAPYAMVNAMGAWRGTVALRDSRATLIVLDRNADGDLSNDPVMLDADADGLVTPIEKVRIGETVRLGSQVLTVLSVAPSGASAQVEVGEAGGSGKDARDLLAELAQAPIPGHPCPDFSFTDQKGESHSRDTLKGRVFLLNFWDVG